MEAPVQEGIVHADQQPSGRLTWTDDPAVKQLLDVLVTILTEEYIETVKRNPGAFSPNGGAP